MAGPQLAQDEAGNIWDVSGAQPRLVRPAQQSPNVVVPAPPKDPPKPEFVPGNPNLVFDPQTRTTSPVPGVAPPAPPAPTFIPNHPNLVFDPKTNSAQPIPGVPAGGGAQLDASVRQKAIQQFNYAKQLQETADQLEQLYMRGPGKTGGIEGLKDFFPSPDNKNFDTAANKSRGIVGQTLGFTGGQLNTEREAAKAVGPFIPESSNFDTTIEQKIQSMRDLAESGKQTAIQTLGGEPDMNGNVLPVTQSNALPPVTPPDGGDQANFATGKTRDVIDPILKATGGQVGEMLSSGVPDGKIRDFLLKSGVNPSDTNVEQALKFRRTDDFKRWQRANPGQAYPIGPDFYTKKVPMSATRTLLNKAAASDVGGSAMAAGAAATNAVTGGYLNDLTVDPAAAQTGMNLLRGQHPVSSLVGDVAGQMALEGMAGGLPGVGKALASPWGRRGADALYGAFSGSGESDGNRGVGAVEGGLGGLAFGALGRGAQRGLGMAATGINNPSLQYLNSKGVPMSVGRIARGADNDFGKAVGGVEDRLAGLPGLDAVIGDVRQQGDRALNSAAFRELPGHSGATGAAGLTEAKQLVGKAYSFLDNAHIGLDPQFNADIAAIKAGAPQNFGSGVVDRLTTIDNAAKNGQLTGRAWQDAIRGIRADRASLRGQPFSDQAVKSLDDAEAALMGLVARNGPADAANKLAAANKLNGQFETLASALDNGPAQKAGELFGAGRLDDAARANARKFGGRTASLTGNRPFYQLTTAAKEVMPNLTPDSGTAGRLAVLRGLGTAGAALGGGIGAVAGDNGLQSGAEGGGLGTAGGLTLAALLMAPYSKTGQKALQKALLAERPTAVKKLGNYLINANPKYTGMFGSALGRDFFFQPELSQ